MRRARNSRTNRCAESRPRARCRASTRRGKRRGNQTGFPSLDKEGRREAPGWFDACRITTPPPSAAPLLEEEGKMTGSSTMEFGVFDHLDLSGSPIERFYRERLELVEAYERAGFHAYHVAEHHLTPLGMAPSPSVFLAAAAQRTRRLRLVPMVFVAPLYHPLRLLEEIGMLDQMSGGRLEIAFGRGALEAELRFYDVDPAQSEKLHQDAVGFVLEALREGAVTVSEEGGRKRRLPLAIPPLQKPHPPLWYGVHSPEAAERAARLGMHVMTLDWAPQMRACTDRFRAAWTETQNDAPLPRIGLARFVYTGRNAAEARATAGRAYRRWHANFTYLSSLMGFKHLRERPLEFDAIVEDGRAYAGTPEGVAEYVQGQVAEAGANYFVGQFAFGDLALEETLRSVGLFAAEVMPMLKRAARLAPV